MQMTYSLEITSGTEVNFADHVYLNFLKICNLMCSVVPHKLMRWEELSPGMFKFTSRTRDDRLYSQTVTLADQSVVNNNNTDSYKISELVYHNEMRASLIDLTARYSISLIVMRMTWA